MPKKRYELAHVEPVMRIDAPWTCGDCRHHRRCSALIGSLRPDAAFCDFAPSRFALDTIGVLARLLDEAGATMTLHGEPVTGDELRSFVRQEAENRIVRAIAAQEDTPR